MGKTRSHSGKYEEKGRISAFRKSLTQDQILELQDAISEFFQTEKEKIRLEKSFFEGTDAIALDLKMVPLGEEMDDMEWKEEENEK